MQKYKIEFNVADFEGLQIGLSSDCFTIDDSKLDSGYFYVISQEDCDEKTFTVKFSCSSVVFEREYRICELDYECGACANCVGGLCEAFCEKECVGGTCVDCLDDTHCPANQICVQGNCTCPSTLQQNEEGECVECLGGDCPACHECEAGACVPTVCGDPADPCAQICNPFTGECVDCITNAQCEEGECCNDGACECCPGYVRVNGVCVPQPNCDDVIPCPACYQCVDGGCQPIVCPDGYICYLGECHPQCNDDSECPTGACTDIGGIGVCLGCTGECTGICPPGCACVGGFCEDDGPPNPCSNYLDCPDGSGCYNGYCHPCEELDGVICQLTSGCVQDGDDCVYNPCSGPCNTNEQCSPNCSCINNVCVPNPCGNTECALAEDCTLGCGCADETCVPCNSVSCTTTIDCPLGCNCQDGTCQTSPCASVTCVNSDDCGIGCTCQEGVCIPCSSFGCVECATINGCACIGGVCQNEPPESCTGTCQDSTNCAPGCTCFNGECVSCSSLNCTQCDTTTDCECISATCQFVGPEVCSDTLSLTKGDCELLGSIGTGDCCPCPEMNALYTITGIQNTSTTTTFTANTQLKQGLINLSLLGIDNALPISGTIRLLVRSTLNKSTVDGVLLTGIITQDQTSIQPFPLTDFASSTFTINKIGTVVPQGINFYKIVKVEIFVEHSSDFIFENGCRYKAVEERILSASSAITSPNLTTQYRKLIPCRTPLLTLFRGTTANNINTKVFSRYTRSFEEDAPEIVALRYYRLTTDCGCTPETVYSCSGGAPNKLVFCDISTPFIEFTECNKRITFLQNVTTDCDIMRLTPAQYTLSINGTIVDTFTVNNAGIIVFSGATYFSVDSISLVEIKIIGDECEECTIDITPPAPSLEAELEIEDIVCSTQVITTATIGPEGISSYSLYINNILFATGTEAETINVFPIDGIWRLEVSDGDCSAFIEINKTFTGPVIAGTYTVTTSCSDGAPRIIITSTQALDVSIPAAGGFVGSVNGGPLEIPVTQGTYQVTFSIDGECPTTENVEVDCCVPNPLDALISPSYQCSTKLLLPAGNTLSFTINGNIVLSGQTLSPGTYAVIGSNGQCTKEYNLIVPTCYACSGLTCVESISGGYSDALCGGFCTNTPDPEVDIEYICSSGFNHTSPVGTTFTIAGNPITTGSIINSGSYTVNVFHPLGSFQLPLVVQQCKMCDPNCEVTGCEVLQRSQFFGDVNFSFGEMEYPTINVTSFNVGGTWTGLTYSGGASVIGAPITLTAYNLDTPDVILAECPCSGPAESCFNCNEDLGLSALQQFAWQDALNAVGVDDFLFETVQCKGVTLITYPTCFSWTIETTYNPPPNYYVVTNGYDAVTNTVINKIEGFGTNSFKTEPEEVNTYGCGSLTISNTEVIDLSCCIDAVPNIGLQICPDECNTPVPPPSCELVYRFPDGLVLGSDPTDINVAILYDNTGLTGTILSLDTSTETVWSGVDHATYETDVLTDLLAAGFVVDTVDVSTDNNPMLTLTGTNFINSSWVAGAQNELDFYTSLPYSSCERSFCIGLEIIDLVSLDLIYVYTDTLMNVSASLTGLDITIPADRLIIKGVIEGLLGSIGEAYDEVIVEEDYIGVRATQAGIIFFGELGLSDPTYDCPPPVEDECVCLTATIFGRSVIGLETNDGTQLLDEDGFNPTGYVLSGSGARTSLQNALQTYYDGIDTFPCTPLVEVTYDGEAEPTSTSTITLSCIPPDHAKALKLWESGAGIFNEFEQTEECECTVRTVCETQEVFVESVSIDGDDCVNSTLNITFTGNVIDISLIDAPAGMAVLNIIESTPVLWIIETTTAVTSGSYTISFTDERECVYYHTFNIDCAGCVGCDFTLHGAGRLYGVVVGGVTYNLGANVGVTCPAGTPVFTPDQATFESILTTTLVNQGECGTLTFEYTCENGTTHDPNNCAASNVLYPYTQWVKVRVLGAGSAVEGAVWGFPGCQVPIEEDYCCQQAGCNVQYIYGGAGKMNSITVGATTYNLLLQTPPIDDAVLQCEDDEFVFSNLEGVLAAIEYVHIEEGAPLTYCVQAECFLYDGGLDPNTCLTTLPNRESFVRISLINSSITIASTNWTGTGFSDCAFPVIDGCI